MTPAGIESATLRFVAQYLNHCAAAEMYHVSATVPHKRYDLRGEWNLLNMKRVLIFPTNLSEIYFYFILRRI
jgi:hypothetical protein